MKKYLITTIMALASILLSSCSLDGLKEDLAGLDDRITKLEEQVGLANAEINGFVNVLDGKLTIVSADYVKDSEGTHICTVLRLSDGSEIKVYTGEADIDNMPAYTIDSEGFLCEKVGPQYVRVLVDGNPVSMRPTDAGTPELVVHDGNWWLKNADGSETKLGPVDGRSVMGGGLFSECEVKDGYVWLKLKSDGSEFELPIENMHFEITAPVELARGETKTFALVQRGIEEICIEATPIRVKISETELELTAPVNIVAGEYELLLTLVNKAGNSRPVTILAKIN